MKKQHISNILKVLTIVLLSSCSTQKDKLINRKYHSLNTKYNVLFNGKEALKIGETIIEATFEDDFYDIIEIDPILLKGEKFDETTIVPGFKKAEDKAVKAIQKHSMNINGLQKNSFIDEAYLLLGKARYYDRRFFPAIEAFNFLLDNNTDESVFIEGRIWREKTNIRLQNNQTAINNLRSLSRNLVKSNKFFGLANATLAQAFINLEKLDSANFYIKRAGNYEKNIDLKARYKYVTAQVNERLGNFDTALLNYQTIVDMNWKVQRKFWINAKIKSLRLLHKLEGTAFVEPVIELLSLYENKMFSHSINRALGVYYIDKNIDSLAQKYLSISLNSQGIDLSTRQKNYRDLIDLNLKNQKYFIAGKYLDSLIPVLFTGGLKQKKALREKENLSDVLFYENQFRETDSLISLLNLNKEQQLVFFENFLSKKRKLAIEKIQLEEKNNNSKSIFKQKNSSNFYFYNDIEVLRGKQFFASTWGKRPNIDNWRDKTIVRFDNYDRKQTNSDILKFTEIEVETPEFYVNNLPDIDIMDSLMTQNGKAALKLGMIYKEKYNARDIAINKLRHILDNDLDSTFVIPALYNLYNLYKVDSIQIANNYKNILVNNYPKSIYAQYFINPENFEMGEYKTPKSLYSEVLMQFDNTEYDELLKKLDNIKLLIANTEWEPKAALLKAQAIGRLNGKTSWMNELESIILDYPNSKVAIKAKNDLKQLRINLKDKTKLLVEFKWVFPLKSELKLKQVALIDSLVANIDDLKLNNWKITSDTYNSEYQFIVIHGIKSKIQVLNLKKKLSKTTLRLIDSNNFITLSAQYRKLFLEKDWPDKNYKDYE